MRRGTGRSAPSSRCRGARCPVRPTCFLPPAGFLLAAGAIAGGGTIGIGLLTAASYPVIVLAFATRRPDLVPRRPLEEERLSARAALGRVWPVPAQIALVCLPLGMITQPVGLGLFVIRNRAQDCVTTLPIFAGVRPFFPDGGVVAALVIVFPAIALALPSLW